MQVPTLHQIAFSKIKGLNFDIASELLSVIGEESDFFRLTEKELQQLTASKSRAFSSEYRKDLLVKAESELEFALKKKINCLYFRNPDYPIRLQNVPDAPLLIYSKGVCDLNSTHIIGVVGTRHSTSYGINVCRNLIDNIAKQIGTDVVVVSGLAYGIDITAHMAALEAGLPTVAVVAHGLDTIYPAPHRNIAVDIVNKSGAIVTEYGDRTRIHRSNFLARNRIIAALSDCVVVVESASHGGALVTANIAQSYGRDVFAFPGRVGDEYSVGCNNLITKNVAALITSADDLIDMMRWKRNNAPIETALFIEFSEEEQPIMDIIREKDVVQLNELSQLLKLPVHKLLNVLFELEMKGVITTLPGNRYRKL